MKLMESDLLLYCYLVYVQIAPVKSFTANIRFFVLWKFSLNFMIILILSN